MDEDDIDYRKFYPGFVVICNKCNGTHVRVECNVGYSPESGGWGGVGLICDDCENKVNLYGDPF